MVVSLKKTGFAFSEVVAILMNLYKIAPGKRDTFIGRLQQLQKAGIPAGSNQGRGVKVRYSASQLITLVACLDLLDCGATPATLGAFFGDDAGQNVETLFHEGKGNFGLPLRTAEAAGMDLYFLFRPRALAYLQTESNADDDSSLLIDADLKVLSRIDDQPSIVVNITSRIRSLRAIAAKLAPSQASELDFHSAGED